MILYAGNTPRWKELLEPVKEDVQLATTRVLGFYYNRFSRLSEYLLVPEAYYEPEDIHLKNVAQQLREELEDRKTTVKPEDNRGKLPDKDTLLYLYGLQIMIANETVADSFASRVCAELGIDVTDWNNRMTHKGDIDDHINGLPNDEFTEKMADWQHQLISSYINSIPELKAVVESLGQYRIRKLRVTSDLIQSAIRRGGVAMADDNDNMQAVITQNGGQMFYDQKSGKFMMRDSNQIKTFPVFILPRTYTPSKISRSEIKDERAFLVASYLHEYGHFVQYALQSLPSVVIASYLMRLR